MSKTKIKYIISMAVILLTLLIVASICDLNIANNIFVNTDNIMALLGGLIGKMPAFLMLAVCFAILMNYVRTHRTTYKTPVFVILILAYIVAILLSYVLAFYSAFEELTSKAKYIAVVLGGISALITYAIVARYTFGYAEELKKWAVVTIISIAVLILSVLFLKTVWGRARYVDVIGEGKPFTPWYIPQGVTGGHSFPSGHTALWGALYMLLPLFGIFGVKGEGWTFLAVFVTQILVGIFRMMGGHHYLSDVTMSMAISFVITMVAVKIAYRDDYSNKMLGTKNILRYI